MLNVDMSLYRQLDNHICTKEDEVNGVLIYDATTPCKQGMVKSFPEGSACREADWDGRVYATCFELNSNMKQGIEDAALDMELWLEDLGPLFDAILTHGMDVTTLTTLIDENSPITPETLHMENGSECPCALPLFQAGNTNYECNYCDSGECKWTFRPAKSVDTKKCAKSSTRLRQRGLLEDEMEEEVVAKPALLRRLSRPIKGSSARA